jgi:hypothetical protein
VNWSWIEGFGSVDRLASSPPWSLGINFVLWISSEKPHKTRKMSRPISMSFDIRNKGKSKQKGRKGTDIRLTHILFPKEHFGSLEATYDEKKEI